MVAVLIWGSWKLTWRKIQENKSKSACRDKLNMEETMTESNLKSDEIPFGIRALEAGVEVEGVVISRPTSPKPAHNRNASNVTLVDGRSSIGSMLNYAQPDSTRNSMGPPSPNFAATSSLQPIQHLRPVYQPSPYAAYSGSTIHNLSSQNSSPAVTRASSIENVSAQTGLRTSSPPQPHHNRVSVLMNGRRSAHIEGLQPGQLSVYGPSTSRSPSPLGIRDSDSSGTDSIGERQTAGGSSNSDGGKEDLYLMHSHRLSHAAEVGQLTRRQPGPSRLSNTSIHSLHSHRTSTMISTTQFSSVDSVDTNLPQVQLQGSPDTADVQQSRRKTLSTFQFNQNVELARELFQPQLAQQPKDETVETEINNRPNSAHSTKSAKKLVKKKQLSHSGAEM